MNAPLFSGPVVRPAPGLIGRIFQGFFFSIFLLAGVFGFYSMLLRPVFQIVEARHWVAIPCRILSSQVVKVDGGDHTSYRLDIDYNYAVDGHFFQSKRYDFGVATSSRDSRAATLVGQFPTGTTATCFVNPRAPDEAVLNRDFQSSLLAGLIPLIFVGIGGAGIAWTSRSGKTASQKKHLVERGTPWLVRKDWAAGRIVSTTKGQMHFFWLFAALWNSIAWPILLILGNHHQQHVDPLIWLVLLFPLIGLGLLILAIRATLYWRKFRDVVFEMTSIPGVIGGALEGNIRLNQHVRPGGTCTIRLSCVRRITTGAGENRSTHESIVWESEHDAGNTPAGTVPVLFAIPADARETNDINPSDRLLWRLEAKKRSASLSIQFEVPVFAVTLNASQAAAAERARAVEHAEQAAYHPPANSRNIVQTSTRGGREFKFPPAGEPGLMIGNSIFFAVITTILVLVIHFHAPIVVSIFFAVLDSVILYSTLFLWVRRVDIVIENGTFTILNHILGFSWKRTTPTRDIKRIYNVVSLRYGNTCYRDIKIVLSSGAQLTAAAKIKDQREAEWLTARIIEAVSQKN